MRPEYDPRASQNAGTNRLIALRCTTGAQARSADIALISNRQSSYNIPDDTRTSTKAQVNNGLDGRWHTHGNVSVLYCKNLTVAVCDQAKTIGNKLVTKKYAVNCYRSLVLGSNPAMVQVTCRVLFHAAKHHHDATHVTDTLLQA